MTDSEFLEWLAWHFDEKQRQEQNWCRVPHLQIKLRRVAARLREIDAENTGFGPPAERSEM